MEEDESINFIGVSNRRKYSGPSSSSSTSSTVILFVITVISAMQNAIAESLNDFENDENQYEPMFDNFNGTKFESLNSTYFDNTSDYSIKNDSSITVTSETSDHYWALFALILVFGTAAGNILVCLAIVLERRLQNVTNYFLMSLAITDLMVAILVMPLSILNLFKGELINFLTNFIDNL